uniref:Uncharacterized protein n=1 Tax=Oryza brachyantha TaxID=4533 RepID=J3M4X4_ORYBR
SYYSQTSKKGGRERERRDRRRRRFIGHVLLWRRRRRRRLPVPAAGVAAGPPVRAARRRRLHRRRHHLDHRAANLVHLPVLPVRDAGAGGGGGAHQGAAPCHDLVHLQDTLLASYAVNTSFLATSIHQVENWISHSVNIYTCWLFVHVFPAWRFGY